MHSSSTAVLSETLTALPGLIQNLLLLLSDKEKEVIVKRFDLDGKRKYTLEEIGREFSVTRERIRQIEKNALSKMRRNVFNTELGVIHDFVDQSLNENGGLIKEDALNLQLQARMQQPDKFSTSCVHLSTVLHDDVECIGNTINFFPYVRNKAITDYSLKSASNALIKQLYKYGDVKKVDRLHRDLGEMVKTADFDLALVKSLITIDKRVTMLEEDLVGLMEWRHIHPRTLRDKILFILRNEKKPMHFGDIAQEIRDKSFDNKVVNIQAVHNELIRHEQFVLIGRGIYALAEWGYEKGTVADVIEAILAESGTLDQDEIVKKVLDQRQVKKITIVLALKNGEKFERVGRKQYKLKKA